jgi:lipid-A-disaccharide synthase
VSANGGGPLVFLTAGEPSGDNLGGRIMAGLKAKTNRRVRFAGIGGERMAEQGLDSLFPMAELSLFGMWEILPHIPNVIRRIRDTAGAIRRARPDAVLTIDSPAFSFAVAKRVAGLGMPLIHLNAPKVWAYRPGRARRVARHYDHLLALLPFEPPYFQAVGLACSFVGHPVLEAGADKGEGRAFRSRHGIPPDAPLLCVLPGSRKSEIKQLLGIFSETVELLAGRLRGLHAVAPTVPTVAQAVSEAAACWPVPALVVERPDDKFDAFAAADVALAASGTVAVELAIAEVPAVIAYRTSPITAAIVRRLARVRFASIVNLIHDRAVVPEFMQEDCRADRLAEAVERLWRDDGARRAQIEGYREAAVALGRGAPSPSERAADIILDIIARRHS